jgi:putative transposon-encoded protein
VRTLGLTGAIIAAAIAIAIALLPATTPASGQATTTTTTTPTTAGWTLTLSAPTGTTTTGFVVNGTVTSDGNAGFVQVLAVPTGTSLTGANPVGNEVDFTAGETGLQPVSVPIDQLTPNTSYTYELQATEDDNDAMFTSATGTNSTTANPTGPGTPSIPPNNPSSNGIFAGCGTDADCLSAINGVRAAQEGLPPLSLPSNWSTLTGPEQIFVWTNLERTSRGEAAIPNLVNTYDAAIQAGLTNGGDPDLTNVPCCGGTIWSGFPTVLSSMYGWMYFDGPGGANNDCQGVDTGGCFGHRDTLLGNASNFSANPTEMDAGAGTDTGGNFADYDALIDPNPNPPPPANIVFTWAQEEAIINPPPTTPVLGDFTGSGSADIALYRPASGTWYINGEPSSTAYGTGTDVPVPGDYLGNGKTQIAVYRPGTGGGNSIWYIDQGTTSQVVQWGTQGDVPVPGDYLGSGQTQVAVYRPGTAGSASIWYIDGEAPIAYGTAGDIPVPGDYLGNGKTQIAVFRPATGTWYIDGGPTVVYGGTGDIPVQGDYLGNGSDQIAVYRPGTGGGNGVFYIDQGTTSQVVPWGTQGDIPVPADYLGNGKIQIAVYRPGTAGTNSIWYIDGITGATAYGTAGDVPVLERTAAGGSA